MAYDITSEREDGMSLNGRIFEDAHKYSYAFSTQLIQV